MLLYINDYSGSMETWITKLKIPAPENLLYLLEICVMDLVPNFVLIACVKYDICCLDFF